MKKRIAIFGHNNIAIKFTEIVSSLNNVEIVFISPNKNDDGIDNWQLSYKKYVDDNKFNVLRFAKIKDIKSIELLRSYNLDFIFSMQYDQIFNSEVISCAKFGAINLHFAPLPKYRGVSPIAHAIMHGEKEFGVTFHYMDPGVDTGDIICQRFFNITSIPNARALYDKCTDEGVDLINSEIIAILNHENNRIPQANEKASYFPSGSIDFKDNVIKWNKDTRSLVNWIKAYIFNPLQFPIFRHDDNHLHVIAAFPDFRKNSFERPGTIVEQNGKYFKIATHDSYINIIVA